MQGPIVSRNLNELTLYTDSKAVTASENTKPLQVGVITPSTL